MLHSPDDLSRPLAAPVAISMKVHYPAPSQFIYSFIHSFTHSLTYPPTHPYLHNFSFFCLRVVVGCGYLSSKGLSPRLCPFSMGPAAMSGTLSPFLCTSGGVALQISLPWYRRLSPSLLRFRLKHRLSRNR